MDSGRIIMSPKEPTLREQIRKIRDDIAQLARDFSSLKDKVKTRTDLESDFFEMREDMKNIKLLLFGDPKVIDDQGITGMVRDLRRFFRGAWVVGGALLINVALELWDKAQVLLSNVP